MHDTSVGTDRASRRTMTKGGLATVMVLFGLVAGGFAGVHALSYLRIYGATADRIANAILNGMNIASAIALFAGPVAIGGWVLYLLRNALRRASKWAIVY